MNIAYANQLDTVYEHNCECTINLIQSVNKADIGQ